MASARGDQRVFDMDITTKDLVEIAGKCKLQRCVEPAKKYIDFLQNWKYETVIKQHSLQQNQLD